MEAGMGGSASHFEGGLECWVGLLLLLLLAWLMVEVVRAARWVWWTPRRLERSLREQGIGGRPYRLFFGDDKESTRLIREAMLKPMPRFSHDIPARIIPLQYQTMKAHGKFSFTWFGPHPRVCIMDTVLIREMLFNKSDPFQKLRASGAASIFVTGLLKYEGEKWAMHRKIINPAFHVEKLKLMLPAFSACCVELMSRWEKLLDQEGTCEIDLWPEFKNFTGDVISLTAFGSNFEDGRRICQLQEELAGLAVRSLMKWQIPGYRYIPTKMNRRMREICKEVKGLLRELILKREKARELGTAACNDDLLGLLLESNRAYSQEDGNSKKVKMTTEDIIEECKLFYTDGQENSSDMLTWAMIALSMYPDWQERARAEVLQVFGRNKPDFGGLSQLKIVTMILHEVLRLYPPIVCYYRSNYETAKLGEYTFPPGVHFLIPILFIHHDPKLWGEDAHEFKPERFAMGVSNASKDPAAFFPFGMGRRICIGQSFAIIQAKVCLAMILQDFSFELSPTYVHAPCTVTTLRPQFGAQVVLRKL